MCNSKVQLFPYNEAMSNAFALAGWCGQWLQLWWLDFVWSGQLYSSHCCSSVLLATLSHTGRPWPSCHGGMHHIPIKSPWFLLPSRNQLCPALPYYIPLPRSQKVIQIGALGMPIGNLSETISGVFNKTDNFTPFNTSLRWMVLDIQVQNGS